MKTICFILPYFGTMPNYFDKFLESCAQNNTINCLVFTDAKTSHSYPDNVTVHYLTFAEFCNYFTKKLGHQPPFPYKLCDYKTTYGYVLQEFITEYDFWGYCDCDLIFGDIRKFVTDEILLHYDKIFTRGHCTLLRNTPVYNELFRKVISRGKYTFTEVWQIPTACASDEWGGISSYCAEHNIPQYDKMVFDDIQYNNLRIFRTTREIISVAPPLVAERKQYCKDKNLIYRYENGKLQRAFLRGGVVCYEEVMYVHFQKRKLDHNRHVPNDCYLIAPNYFAEIEEHSFSVTHLKTLTPYDTFFWVTAKHAKNHILHLHKRIIDKIKRTFQQINRKRKEKKSYAHQRH